MAIDYGLIITSSKNLYTPVDPRSKYAVAHPELRKKNDKGVSSLLTFFSIALFSIVVSGLVSVLVMTAF